MNQKKSTRAAPAFAQLLSTAPGSCKDIRKELEKIHGLRVSGSTYSVLWKNLVGYFGVDGAATVVEDVVDIRIERKALTRLWGKRQKAYVDAMLMGRIGEASKRGRVNLRKTQLVEKHNAELAHRRKRKQVLNHDHIRLPSIDYGRGYNRASAISYLPIERVTIAGSTKLRARSNWLERNLENYLETHWAELDFGLGRVLQLEGRQVGLNNSNEKVDLLAKLGDVLVPIELKIKRAGGSDLTQLQSYRQDLINRGQAPENVLGILVAPQFSSKVLNVVSGSPGIILRWFELPM